MPPTLHLVRHAQGFHNVPPENYNLHDPEITELGKEQCRQIRSSFPYTEGVELVVASPLKRTLQTALHGFGNILIRDSSRIIAIPEFQETSAAPCDTGSSVPVLTKHFAADPVDFDAVPADWNCKRGKWGPHEKEIQKRAHVARSWLKSRQEKEIVVVSHGGFLHYLTEDWASANKFPGMTPSQSPPTCSSYR